MARREHRTLCLNGLVSGKICIHQSQVSPFSLTLSENNISYFLLSLNQHLCFWCNGLHSYVNEKIQAITRNTITPQPQTSRQQWSALRLLSCGGGEASTGTAKATFSFVSLEPTPSPLLRMVLSAVLFFILHHQCFPFLCIILTCNILLFLPLKRKKKLSWPKLPHLATNLYFSFPSQQISKKIIIYTYFFQFLSLEPAKTRC